MEQMPRSVYMKYSVFLGAFLSGAATGVPLFYGNMLVYTSSYLRAHGGSQSDSSSPLLISVFFATHSFAFLLSRPIFRCLGTRGGYCLGLLACVGGAVSSFSSVQFSTVMLTATFGGLQGVGAGLVRASSLLFSLDWAPSHRSGTVIAFTSCGVAIGAVGINFGITQFVNPENVKQDVLDGPAAYFSQTEILDRVPLLFLLLASLIFVTQFVGALLMMMPYVLKEGDKIVFNGTVKSMKSTNLLIPKQKEGRDSETPGIGVETLSDKKVLSHSSISDEDKALSSSDLSVNKNNFAQVNATIGKADLLGTSLESSENAASQFTIKTSEAGDLLQSEVSTNYSSSDEDENETEPVDSSPLMMVKSKFFYLLLLTVSFSEFTYIVSSNYYKQFAQIYVKDDHFLTNVAMGVVVMNVVGKILWGRVLDSCTPATGLVLLSSLQCTCITLWYFAPSLGKPILCLWALILSAVNSGTPVLFTVSVLRTYGRTFFPSNVGVLSCASALANLMGPTLARLVLYRYGWFQLFFTAGCLNCCGVLITAAYYVIGMREKSSPL